MGKSRACVAGPHVVLCLYLPVGLDDILSLCLSCCRMCCPPVQVHFGYNAATDKFEDLMEAGIIDPTKVRQPQRSCTTHGVVVTAWLPWAPSCERHQPAASRGSPAPADLLNPFVNCLAHGWLIVRCAHQASGLVAHKRTTAPCRPPDNVVRCSLENACTLFRTHTCARFRLPTPCPPSLLPFPQMKVVRCSMENACSVAKTFLLADVVVTEIPEKEAAPAPAPGGGDFGGF